MIYSKLLTTLYRARFGEPVAVAEADADALILIADGVGGFDLTSFGLRHVAGRDATTLLVRAVSWGHGWGRWWADLSNVADQRRGAEKLAGEVQTWVARHPDRPVFLVGKSGGTAIVAGALERLPEGSVASALLLASALSPGYDLSTALRAVRGELVAFWSPYDVLILGVGTLLFGTMDRVRSVGAGLVGFRVPQALDDDGRRRYAERLRQVRWGRAMIRVGNLGGHAGTDNPAFLRRYVVPLLRHDAANPSPEASPGSSGPIPSSITR